MATAEERRRRLEELRRAQGAPVQPRQPSAPAAGETPQQQQLRRSLESSGINFNSYISRGSGETAERRALRIDRGTQDGISADVARLRAGQTPTGEWADKLRQNQDQLERTLVNIANSDLSDDEKARLLQIGSKSQDKFWLWNALEWVDRWSGDSAVRALFSQVEKVFDPDEDPSFDSFAREWRNNVSWSEILAEYDIPDWLTRGGLDAVANLFGKDIIPANRGEGPGGMVNEESITALGLDILTSPTTYLTGGSKAVAQVAGQGAIRLSRSLTSVAKTANQAGDLAKANRAAQLATRTTEVGFGGLSQTERRLATELLQESGELTGRQSLRGGVYFRPPGTQGIYVPGTRALASVTYRPAAIALRSLKGTRAAQKAAAPFATVQRNIMANMKSGDQGKIGQALETLAARNVAEAETAHWFVEGDQILNGLIRRAKKLRVKGEEISFFLEDADSASALGIARRYQMDDKVRALLDDIVDFQRRHWLVRYNRMAGYEAISELDNYVPTLLAPDFMQKIMGARKGMGSEFSPAGFQKPTQFRVGEEYMGIMIVPAEMHPRALTPKQQGEAILREFWGDDFVGPLYDRNWFKAAKNRQFVARYRLRGEMTARYLKERGVAWTPQQADRLFSAPLTDMKKAMSRYGLRKWTEPAAAARQAAMARGQMPNTAGTQILMDMRALDEIVEAGGDVGSMAPRLANTGEAIAKRDKEIAKLIARRKQIAERVQRIERKMSSEVGRMTAKVRAGGQATEAEQQAAAALTAWSMGVEPEEVAKLYDEWATIDQSLAPFIAEADLDADDLEKLSGIVGSLITERANRLEVVNEALRIPDPNLSPENLMRLKNLRAEKVEIEQTLDSLLQMNRNMTSLEGSSRRLTRLRDGLDEEQQFNMARKRILENKNLSGAQKRERIRRLHKQAPVGARHGMYSRAIDRLIELAPDGVAKTVDGSAATFVRRPVGMEAARLRGSTPETPKGAMHGAPGRDMASDKLGLHFDFADDHAAEAVENAVDAMKVNVKLDNPRMLIGVEDSERVLQAEMLLAAVDAKMVDLEALPALRGSEAQFVQEVNAVLARHAGALDEGPDGVMRFVDDLDETLARMDVDGNPIAQLFVNRASERMAASGASPDAVKVRRDIDNLESQITNKLDELEGQYGSTREAFAALDDSAEVGPKIRPITQKMLDALEQRAPDARKAVRQASKRAQKQKRPIYVSEYGEKETVSALGYRIGVTDPKYGNYFRLNPDGTGDFIVVTPGQVARKPVEAAPELPLAKQVEELEKLLRKQRKSARKAERDYARFSAGVDEWDAFLATNPSDEARLAKALEQRAELSPKGKKYTPEEAKNLPRNYVDTYDKWIRAMRKEYELRIGENQRSLARSETQLAELNTALRQENPLPAGALDPESPEAQIRFVRVTVSRKLYRDFVSRNFVKGWSVADSTIPSPRAVKMQGANGLLVEGEYRVLRQMLDDVRARAELPETTAADRATLRRAEKSLEKQFKEIDASTDFELRPRSEFDWPPYYEHQIRDLEELAQQAATDRATFDSLVDDYARALDVEPDLRELENPSGVELVRLQADYIKKAKDEIAMLEDYMISTLGAFTDEKGLVRFPLMPKRVKEGAGKGGYTGEWDWLNHYLPGEKSKFIIRWFDTRSKDRFGFGAGGEGGVDTALAHTETMLGRDVSADEYAEMMMDAIAKHEAATENLKFYRNATSQDLIDENVKEYWEYVSRDGPRFLSTQYERLFDRVEEIQEGIPFERSVAFEQADLAAKATDEGAAASVSTAPALPPSSVPASTPTDPNALASIETFRTTGAVATPDPELAAALQAVKKQMDLADELRGYLREAAVPPRGAAFGLIDELTSPALRSMARADGEEYIAQLGEHGAWLGKLPYSPDDVAESYRGFLRSRGHDGVMSDDLSFRRVIALDQKQVRPADKASRLALQLEELQIGMRQEIRQGQQRLADLADKTFGYRIERQTMKQADAKVTAAENLARLKALDPSDATRGEIYLRTRAQRAFKMADEFEAQGETNAVMNLRLEAQSLAAQADQLAAGVGDDAGVLLKGNLSEIPGLPERIARYNGMALKNLDARTVAEDWVVEMLTVGEKLTLPGEIKGLLKVWDYITNTLFKSYAIMTFGFHIRNLFGGVMNNWLGGVNVDSYRVFLRAENVYFAALRKTGNVDEALRAVDGKLGKSAGSAYRQWHRMEASSGMGIVGSFSEDVGRGVSVLSDSVNAGGTSRLGAARAAMQSDKLTRDRLLNPLVGLQDNFLVRANAYAGQRVERFLRGSMAFDTFYKKGGDFTDAMLRVRKYHFDYQDLSNFERGFLRRVIPFYVWISRNIPLQIEGLVTRPKVALTYWRLKEWIESHSEEEAIVADYYGREGAIRLPFTDANGDHIYWFPDMPINDLNFFSNPVEVVTSAINPLVKMPMEIGPMQRKFFTGAPFTEELQEMPRHYGWAGITQGLEALGQVTRDREGRPMADQRLIYALEQGWPMFARLQRWFPNTEEGRARASNTYLSNFLGVSVRTNDQRTKSNAVRSTITELEEEINKQKGLGSNVKIAGYREISNSTRTVELNMDRLRYETDFLLTAVNTFDNQMLEEIPGIGETAARWIVLSRQQNGEYTDLRDLMQVENLSENKVNEILLSLAEKPESMGLPTPKAIDLNAGTAQELEALPGIGESTARKIVDFRTRFGPIRNIWQLAEIDGIRRDQIEEIRNYYLEDQEKRASEEYRRYLRMGGGRPLEEVVGS